MGAEIDDDYPPCERNADEESHNDPKHQRQNLQTGKLHYDNKPGSKRKEIDTGSKAVDTRLNEWLEKLVVTNEKCDSEKEPQNVVPEKTKDFSGIDGSKQSKKHNDFSSLISPKMGAAGVVDHQAEFRFKYHTVILSKAKPSRIERIIMTKHVLMVGHCGMDSRALQQRLTSLFDVEVSQAATLEETLEKMRAEAFALVLINRLLDEDRSEGVAVIERCQQDEDLSSMPLMLISNFSESHEKAVEAGAVQGFGKSDLYSEDAKKLLAEYLAE